MKEKELRLKPLKCANELETFINTIYENLFDEITDLEKLLNKENEPLHYLITKIRIEEARKALNMFEAVVDNATEYQETEKTEVGV